MPIIRKKLIKLKNKKTMLFFKQKAFKSHLFTEQDFYKRFILDLNECQREIIIESPYITSYRIGLFMPIFSKLLDKRIQIHIVTRDPIDHDEYFRDQATNGILACNEMGINIVMLKNNHHRKLAIIDRKILWEGSLNILSYNRSQEVMRRIEGEDFAQEMIDFLNLDKFV